MMRHLFNVSAYDFDLDRLGGAEGIASLVREHRLHGVEMLTGHFPAPAEMADLVEAVHLPYAVDWYGGWTGRHMLDGISDETVLFFCYGRDRSHMVDTVEAMMSHASALRPAYGVMHAASPNILKVFSQDNGYEDRKVIEAFAEMVNEAVSRFPGGTPPFTLALENLWWPGLRLCGPGEAELLERKLEFDDWGICLDTGHLMNALRECRDEEEAVEAAVRALDRIGARAVDRIIAMHLHLSLSADYQLETIAAGEPQGYEGWDLDGKLKAAYPHFGRMDWHAAFDTEACRALVEAASPRHVTHEFITPDKEGLRARLSKQLAHFPERRG